MDTLYGKKGAEFIYVVRGMIGEGSPHKIDCEGGWSRSDKLSIVAAIPMDFSSLHENVAGIQEVVEKL